MRLLVLVDSHEYARGNCYIHQLLLTLERHVTTVVVSLDDIKMNRIKYEDFDRILSCLKLRTLYRDCVRGPIVGELVERFLRGRPVYVYEQDPWESESDGATFPGAYKCIAKCLNVKSFLNTSQWWSDLINSRGLPSKFVTMWMLPEYCSADPPWTTRKVDVGFCGQLHPYRQELFEQLQREGINVQHFPSGDYQHYLRTLSQMKIFVHSEQVNWSVGGVKLAGPNALWIKDIEAASRGCISMREYERECISYDGAEIPTIWPFDDVPGLVRDIKYLLTEAEDTPDENTHEAVDMIRAARGWRTILDAMEIT